MRIVTVSVGMPQIIQTGNEGFVTTGIFKNPVEGRIKVGQLNLDGDAQADLRVHGGPHKAVYAYPSEHYEFWKSEYPHKDLEVSQFGENLSTEGLIETELFIGDRLRIGTAEFVVAQPRMPCYKLAIRFGHKDILRRFLQSRRSGFYLAVTKTGELGAGDEIEIISRDENKVSVTDIVRLYVEDKDDVETMTRALRIASLPDSWKDSFRERMVNS